MDGLTETVMTPSLPTRSIARAMSCPISVSPLAEIVPTCSMKPHTELHAFHWLASAMMIDSKLSGLWGAARAADIHCARQWCGPMLGSRLAQWKDMPLPSCTMHAGAPGHQACTLPDHRLLNVCMKAFIIHAYMV